MNKKYLRAVLATTILTPFVVQNTIYYQRIANEANVGATESELPTLKLFLNNFKLDCGRFPNTNERLAALEVSPQGLEKKWRGPYVSQPITIDPFGNAFSIRRRSKITSN